jgi:hypothetical protein
MENETQDVDKILDKKLWEAEQKLNIAISNYNTAAKALYFSRIKSEDVYIKLWLAPKIRRIKSMNLEGF